MIRMSRHAWLIALCFSLFIFQCYAGTRTLSVGAKFSGVLVENLIPCSIRSGDENIQLPIAAINLHGLKARGEGPRYPFTVHLENCELDPDIPGDITVWLSGQSDGSGGLKLSSDSTAAGVVIGIENVQGDRLPINAATPALTIPLNTAEVALKMQAYLQVVDEKALAAGTFSATLNYVVEYR